MDLFDYDIEGKRQLDKEVSPLLLDYYENHKEYPVKITISVNKLKEFERAFPTKYKHVLKYDEIPIEVNENQKEDYKLVAK